jgi:hypothetical protein
VPRSSVSADAVPKCAQAGTGITSSTTVLVRMASGRAAACPCATGGARGR